MARVLKALCPCASLAAVGDRVYSLSTDAQTLLCLDPVTERQTCIPLGAEAPQNKQLSRIKLVGCRGKLFVCMQFQDDSLSIVKYDPTSAKFQTIDLTTDQGGLSYKFLTAAELKGRVYFVCEGGLWELNAETEAIGFLENDFVGCSHACGSGGQLCIFGDATGVWKLDPESGKLKVVNFEQQGKWMAKTSLQGELFASWRDSNDSTSIWKLQDDSGGERHWDCVANLEGRVTDSLLAVDDLLVMSSKDKLIICDPATGETESDELQIDSDLTMRLPCVVSGKWVALSNQIPNEPSLVVVDLAGTRWLSTCGDNKPASSRGQTAADSMQTLMAQLHRAKATAEAATESAANARTLAEAAANAAAKARVAAEEATEAIKEAEAAAKVVAEDKNGAQAAAVAAAESAEMATTAAAWQMVSHLPPYGSEAPVQQQVLPVNDPRHTMISKLLRESCTSHRRAKEDQNFCAPPDLVLTEVSKVCNPGLARHYHCFREQIQERRSTGNCRQLEVFDHLLLPCPGGCEKNQLNEVLLFHGATVDIVEDICREGFDPRRGGENTGAMFGFGTYFAANASKADIYTERRSSKLSRRASRKLILARVLLGDAYRATSTLRHARRPPDGPDGRPYDSVWADTRDNGGAVDHPEAVVYDRGQAIPLFVVTYSHSDTCQCAECGKRPA